jgi:hypothetical protein
MFRDVVLPLWQDWVPRHLYEFNRSDQFFFWKPTRRRIFVRSSTEPDRASGLNIGFFWLDEGALIRTDKFWKILLARLRQPASRPCGFVTTTPNGLDWLALWFAATQRRAPASVMLVRCRTADNAHLPDDFEAGLRAAYGEEYAAQMLDARIVQLFGLAWPIVPAIHCSMSIAEMRTRSALTFGAVDWGHTNPAAVLVGGLDREGRWYLRRLWYKRGQTREDIAKEAARIGAAEDVRAWFIDHDPEGEQQMKRAGLEVFLANKAVESGVMHVRSLLAVRGDREPHLFVAGELAEWHREQSSYIFPEGEEEPVGPNGDHAMDATRYLTFSPTTLSRYQLGKLGLLGIAGFGDAHGSQAAPPQLA